MPPAIFILALNHKTCEMAEKAQAEAKNDLSQSASYSTVLTV